MARERVHHERRAARETKWRSARDASRAFRARGRAKKYLARRVSRFFFAERNVVRDASGGRSPRAPAFARDAP